MARTHRPDLKYVYRGVITYRYPNGKEYVEYSGPYTAKGYIRAKHWRYHPSATTTTMIQRSELNWETIETLKEHHD